MLIEIQNVFLIIWKCTLVWLSRKHTDEISLKNVLWLNFEWAREFRRIEKAPRIDSELIFIDFQGIARNELVWKDFYNWSWIRSDWNTLNFGLSRNESNWVGWIFNRFVSNEIQNVFRIIWKCTLDWLSRKQTDEISLKKFLWFNFEWNLGLRWIETDWKGTSNWAQIDFDWLQRYCREFISLKKLL